MYRSYLLGGVFLQKIDSSQLPGPGRLLRATLAWTISAAVLVLLGASLLCLLRAGEESLAYVSAAVSFFAAFAAGHAAGKGGGSRLFSGLICGFALCILLLTLGFLIKGGALDASAVLSVTSFTIAGALSGAVLCRSGKKKRRRAAFAQRA